MDDFYQDEDIPEEFEDYEDLIDFNEVIDAFLDPDNIFPARYLYSLSGLEHLELEQFTEAWPQADPARRSRLIEDLETLADAATHLDFDQVFLLGLKEVNPHTRLVALRSLWESDSEAVAAEYLEIMQSDPSSDVCAQAARNLGVFVHLSELEEVDETLAGQIKETLFAAAEEGQTESVRRAAVESLGFSSARSNSPLIDQAFQNEKEDWLVSALVAAGRSADDQWLPHIIRHFGHDSAEVRLEAAQAAGLLYAQQAVPHLLQLIDDPEEDVKKAAIWALSEIGGIDARAAIEGLLRNSAEEEEIEFLEEALENLDFNDSAFNFELFDLSEDDLEDMMDDEDIADQL